MNEFDLLKQLGTRSAAEPDPHVDVVAGVIQQIARRRASTVDPRLPLVSICACALSALALVALWSAPPISDGLASLSEAAATNTGPDALLRVFEP